MGWFEFPHLILRDRLHINYSIIELNYYLTAPAGREGSLGILLSNKLHFPPAERLQAGMWDSGNITTNILIIQKKNIYTSWDGKSFLFENIRKILQHPQLFCLRDEESSSVGFLIYNALSQMQCRNSNFSVILEDFQWKITDNATIERKWRMSQE